MSNKLIILVLGFLIYLFNTSISAVEIDSLYHVEIEVDDHSTENRQQATLQGFKEVLVRKSGSINILSSYEVTKSYSKVISYLQRFEYSRNQNFIAVSANPAPLAVNEQQNRAYILKLDFEPRLVDELIQVAGMPIWGSNRPLTLMWLALADDTQRRIIRDDVENNLYSSMVKSNGIRRGIPLMLPLMDLEDQQNLKISDVWGRFTSEVIPASQRYAADSVVFGKIEQIDTNWLAKLSFFTYGNELSFELSESTLDLLFNSITNRIADLLCEKYCVVEVAERHQIVIQVSNVRKFNQFTKIKNHLSNLSAIRNVEIDKIAGDQLRLKLSLLGDINSLKEALSLNDQLIKDENPMTEAFQVTNKTLPLNEPALNEFESINKVNLVQTALDKPERVNLASEAPIALAIKEESILFYRWVE